MGHLLGTGDNAHIVPLVQYLSRLVNRVGKMETMSVKKRLSILTGTWD